LKNSQAFDTLVPSSITYYGARKPGHEIDFENVEILDRADTVRKLEYKEMLYIRKLKPTINKQTEGELFTLIIRNVKLESSMERDIQKYLKKPNNKNFKKQSQ
jgi:hypothetical protein